MKYDLINPILLLLIGVANGCCFLRANRYTVHYKAVFQQLAFLIFIQSIVAILCGAVPVISAYYYLSVGSPWLGFLFGLFIGHIYGNRSSCADDPDDLV